MCTAVGLLNSLKTKINLNKFYTFSSHRTVNTLRHRFKNQQINLVYGNNGSLLWYPYKTETHNMWTVRTFSWCETPVINKLTSRPWSGPPKHAALRKLFSGPEAMGCAAPGPLNYWFMKYNRTLYYLEKSAHEIAFLYSRRFPYF